jgi:hypothetical protein
MALIKDDTRVRLAIPHEPGAWIEIRPSRNSDLEQIDFDADPFAGMLKLLDLLVKGWSYDEPVTPASIRMLDSPTTTWLSEELKKATGLRTAEEKNGSTSNS